MNIDLSQKICSCKCCRNLFNPVYGAYNYCPVCMDAHRRNFHPKDRQQTIDQFTRDVYALRKRVRRLRKSIGV